MNVHDAWNTIRDEDPAFAGYRRLPELLREDGEFSTWVLRSLEMLQRERDALDQKLAEVARRESAVGEREGGQTRRETEYLNLTASMRSLLCAKESA